MAGQQEAVRRGENVLTAGQQRSAAKSKFGFPLCDICNDIAIGDSAGEPPMILLSSDVLSVSVGVTGCAAAAVATASSAADSATSRPDVVLNVSFFCRNMFRSA
ncbi:hypothetical protein NLX83_15470 [Allokutzneria sp. A3M-2-11 16]|uniref:hypothetical protein n=1 Tax=Allokutzneria sp. A3M-2-11 16 TaxID=2962043 RepID=UPI0020B8AA98|nr:hypothetical protein [Allokutzneria sp. A3M-2-11 16]MCP3800666.1 hypothetical protein [Allokutzneria sp. A3M-2-11 16]